MNITVVRVSITVAFTPRLWPPSGDNDKFDYLVWYLFTSSVSEHEHSCNKVLVSPASSDFCLDAIVTRFSNYLPRTSSVVVVGRETIKLALAVVSLFGAEWFSSRIPNWHSSALHEGCLNPYEQTRQFIRYMTSIFPTFIVSPIPPLTIQSQLECRTVSK